MVTSYSYLGSIVLKGLGYTLTTPIIIILDTGSVERGFCNKVQGNPQNWCSGSPSQVMVDVSSKEVIDPSSKGVPDTAIVIRMLNSYSWCSNTSLLVMVDDGGQN